MTNITKNMNAYDRLDKFISEGRIVRRVWGDGKERACLLSALAPECAEATDSYACPAELMPAWLARMVPEMDDEGSEAAWEGFVKDFAAAIRKTAGWEVGEWQQLEYKVKIIAIEEAMQHTKDEEVLEICGKVISLLLRAGAGEDVAEELAAAEDAAWAAAWVAAEADKEAAAWAAWDRMNSAIIEAMNEISDGLDTGKGKQL